MPCYSSQRSPKPPEKPVEQPIKEAPKHIKKFRGSKPNVLPLFYFEETDKALLKFAIANSYLKKIGWKREEAKY